MKKLIKFNLLFTAIAVLVVCSAAATIHPHPETCKKYVVKVDIPDGRVDIIVNACPDDLCYIPEKVACDFSVFCRRCH